MNLTELFSDHIEPFIDSVFLNEIVNDITKEIPIKQKRLLNRKIYIILGCVFILVSGLLYTLENLREAIVYVGANVSKNSGQAYPFPPSIVELSIPIIFALISVVFFYNAIRNKQKD
jgi:hypothetical protein